MGDHSSPVEAAGQTSEKILPKSQMNPEELILSLGNSATFGSLKKIIKQSADAQAVDESVPDAQVKRAHRADILERSKKSLNSFGPQVQQIRRSNHIDLAKNESVKGSSSISSTSALIAMADSKTDFEREFREAIEETGISWNDKTVSTLPATPIIQADNERRQMARIRTLLRAEQIRARRLKNIKSKTYRKLVRQKEARGMQDLINKLDREDPEAAEHMKAELERKLSSLRLNRQRQARIKWSQAAQRFGGREIRTEVSRQAQADADERKDLIRAVKGKPTGESGSEDSDSDDSFDCDTEDIVAKVKATVQSKVISNPPGDTSEKGLMGMKFMQEAQSRKQKSTIAEAQSFIGALEDEGSDSETGSETGSRQESGDDGACSSQQAMVAQLFATEVVTPSKETSKKGSSYTIEKPENEADALPGWGDWAGEGVKNRRKLKPKQQAIVGPSSGSAVVSALADDAVRAPLLKYQVKDIPYPFKSKREFEVSQARPLGPEWQSLTAHAEAIQPKISARLGAVVPPIVLAKHLTPDKRAKIIEAWDSRKKIKHTKARFL